MNEEEVKEYFSKNEDKCNEVLDLVDYIKEMKRNIADKHKLLKTYSDQIISYEERLERFQNKLTKLLSNDEKLSEMYLRLVVKENITT